MSWQNLLTKLNYRLTDKQRIQTTGQTIAATSHKTQEVNCYITINEV